MARISTTLSASADLSLKTRVLALWAPTLSSLRMMSSTTASSLVAPVTMMRFPLVSAVIKVSAAGAPGRFLACSV